MLMLRGESCDFDMFDFVKLLLKLFVEYFYGFVWLCDLLMVVMWV